jgi:hypothetical protein
MEPSGASSEELLTEFYTHFGWPGERPPRVIGLSGSPLLEDARASGVVADELALLRTLLTDERRKDLVRDCRTLVSEIADLGSDVRMLQEIERHLSLLEMDSSRLLLGLALYAQAAGSDPATKAIDHWDPILSSSLKQGVVSHTFAKAVEGVGATILRLYVAMVYLRGDAMTSSLGRVDGGSAPRLHLIRRLFSHELVRHMRNAVAHGHVSLSLGGLRLVDRSFEIVITPGLAENMCTWMFLFYFQSMMVISKGDG